MINSSSISHMLFEYENLWQFFSYINAPLPCMDADFDVIDECDYYGCDFTGKHKMCMIWFTGQSNYFPGFWIGDNELDTIDNIDEYPIYIIDIAMDCGNQVQNTGLNIKGYINKLIEHCESVINSEDYIHDETYCDIEKINNDIENLKNIIKTFSDVVIEQDELHLVINDE